MQALQQHRRPVHLRAEITRLQLTLCSITYNRHFQNNPILFDHYFHCLTRARQYLNNIEHYFRDVQNGTRQRIDCPRYPLTTDDWTDYYVRLPPPERPCPPLHSSTRRQRRRRQHPAEGQPPPGRDRSPRPRRNRDNTDDDDDTSGPDLDQLEIRNDLNGLNLRQSPISSPTESDDDEADNQHRPRPPGPGPPRNPERPRPAQDPEQEQRPPQDLGQDHNDGPPPEAQERQQGPQEQQVEVVPAFGNGANNPQLDEVIRRHPSHLSEQRVLAHHRLLEERRVLVTRVRQAVPRSRRPIRPRPLGINDFSSTDEDLEYRPRPHPDADVDPYEPPRPAARLTYAETHLDLNEDLDTIHSFELLPIQHQIDRTQERSRRLRARANGGNARHQEEPQQNGRPRLQRQQAVIEIPDQAGGAQNHIIGIYELRQENH